ncbi:MAG TPA: PD-(D/E)XK nuclease family protein [Vicinamibacteria bacterium]|nr:PD-(D/E)XK nuclease family protein [Vicinamibacteria bacterium]
MRIILHRPSWPSFCVEVSFEPAVARPLAIAARADARIAWAPLSLRPLVLLTPSSAAAVELPRRLASTGRALAGVYPMKPLDLALALAEPVLLGRGLAPWTSGHDALVAARLLAESGDAGLRFPEGTPRAPVAAALARTLGALRRAGIPPARLADLADAAPPGSDDARRLAALARLYRAFEAAVEGRLADPVTLLAAARGALPAARWLDGAEIVVADDLELDRAEAEFVAALAAAFPVRVLRRPLPPSLRPDSFRSRLASRGVAEAEWSETPLAALGPPDPPPSLRRLRESLFEPPAGFPVEDGAVELVTAPGEAAEVRSLARRLLREAARGVPFEEMGVVLPRPETYAPLFTDLLARLGVPHRLHPSLPLRFGRAARALLLLFRCRGLERRAVMELLTFAPVPFADLLGPGAPAQPARWDQLSREAGIVSGLSRWIVGLRAWGEAEREAAEVERDEDRRARRLRHVADAEALLRVVELLGATLDGLAGEARWPEWVERLRTVVEQWIGPERDRDAVLEVIADLGGLGSVAERARWEEVEQVVEARFEWERLPLEPLESGAVHVGALDAMAGLPFRVVAVPGLVEGGYPGVFRPDPFLLDSERLALGVQEPDLEESGSSPALSASPNPPRSTSRLPHSRKPSPSQLSLLWEEPVEVVPGATGSAPTSTGALPTTQDRLLEARRLFHRAVSQATERLFLSYPRADGRTGRERLPSLFFAAAASTLAGRPLAGAELEGLVAEDDPGRLPLEDAVDEGERDRLRVRRDETAATAIAAGSAFFRQSRLASQARWSGRLTRYDGLVVGEGDEDLAARLDPLLGRHPVSASRLATYARCGFLYLLQNVLHLQPAPEPEERRRIEPLERGDLFHRVAERYLRERRDRGELPVRATEPARTRLAEMAEEALEGLVAGSPPRFTLLWQREKRRFHDTVQAWLVREAAGADRSTPAHFELSFGLGRERDAEEPHDPEPLEIDLGDGRMLRVSGKIDRIDRREDGLVLRDYKTGRAPKDDGGIFRGGKQLQIPFYVLATARLLPGERVVDAFLDYVDGGRQVAFRPDLAEGAAFRDLLGRLVGLVARGVFAQEPTACDFCDFTAVCGPKALLERRQSIKVRDRSLQEYLRLRDVS